MKPGDQIYRWMTPSPQTIHADATLFEAIATMRRYEIRHLPVMDRGQLVGMISERDIAFAERFLDARESQVATVMTGNPYVVAPFAPLVEVVETMITEKYGSAVIIDKGNVVGVFTTVDALRAIVERPLSGDTASG